MKIFRTIFTLIELLVVIGIIVILLSILLPALREAKASAKGIHCKSNLKQCGAALGSYINDFNGWFPYSINWAPSLYENDYLPTPKAGKSTILKCPYGRKYGDIWISSTSSYGMSVRGVTPYPYWRVGVSGVFDQNDSPNWTDTPPSKFLLLGDSIYLLASSGAYLSQIYYIPSGTNNIASARHKRKAQFLFGDLHVDGVNKNEFVELGWKPEQIYLYEY